MTVSSSGDNFTTEDWRRLGVFCGQTLPAPITSETNVLRVLFQSDNSVQKSGFSAIFFTGNFQINPFIKNHSESFRKSLRREIIWGFGRVRNDFFGKSFISMQKQSICNYFRISFRTLQPFEINQFEDHSRIKQKAKFVTGFQIERVISKL